MIAVGDYVERLLSRLGVTKERVSAVIGKPCKCHERQEALNRVGYRWQMPVLRFAHWLRQRASAAKYGKRGMRLRRAAQHFAMAFRLLVFDD